MSKIIYITGGERSGKSSYAQKVALQLSTNPVYLATSNIDDEEFESRVQRHQQDRGDEWETIEEPMSLSNLRLDGKTILLDCITLWLYNIYYAHHNSLDDSLEYAKMEWSKFIDQNFNLIVVSNELGMGVHGTTAEIRKFVELQGWMNQHIAKQADEAWLMVSGLPLKIK